MSEKESLTLPRRYREDICQAFFVAREDSGVCAGRIVHGIGLAPTDFAASE
jgi:hypothetical protein